MSLTSQDSRLSSLFFFPRPISDDHQERCYPNTPAKTAHGNSSLLQLLATALHPTLEARNRAETCLWHWEGGLLTLLPSMRASVPSFWQPICFQLCLKPHSGQGYTLTRQLHLLGSSSMFQTLQRLETAAGQSPLLPKQGQGDIPPWEESSKHLCSPWPDGARPHASTKPEHLYQSGIYVIRNHLGFILSERQFSSPDLLLKLRLAGLEGALHAALKY